MNNYIDDDERIKANREIQNAFVYYENNPLSKRDGQVLKALVTKKFKEDEQESETS